MRGPRLHLIGMYFTEALAIASLVLWCFRPRIEFLLFFVALVVVTATLHVTYLLSCVYERIKAIEEKMRERGG